MNINDLLQQDISIKKQEEVIKHTDIENNEILCVVVKSQLLGEEIILLKDKTYLNQIREEFPGIVIYFPPEIEEIFKIKDKNRIKQLHQLKKSFSGWIVPSTN